MGKSIIQINSAWCKSCGICVEFCPKKVLELKIPGGVSVANPEACIGCRLCELRCPDYVITVEGGGSVEK